LSAGKGKKTNKILLDACNSHVANHKYHVSKLEGIMRLVNNDRLDVDAVDGIKDDLDYYLDSYEDEDYQQAYDEDFFYESLGLDELDVVNVDRVTTVPPPTKKASGDNDASSSGSKESKDKKSNKKGALASVIPMTIGRARVSSTGKEKEKEEQKVTPSKLGRAVSTPTPVPVATPPPVVTAPVPPARPSSTQPAAGASMAAILKRETEQQEKERQKVSQLNCCAFAEASNSLLGPVPHHVSCSFFVSKKLSCDSKRRCVCSSSNNRRSKRP
jgi:CCR4-NOT transcription complex subunit 3